MAVVKIIDHHCMPITSYFYDLSRPFTGLDYVGRSFCITDDVDKVTDDADNVSNDLFAVHYQLSLIVRYVLNF